MKIFVSATRAALVPSVRRFQATAGTSVSVTWAGPAETATTTSTSADRVTNLLTYLLIENIVG